MQDVIQREISIRAPKERVYNAIADPGQIVAWFPDAVEGKLEAGESPILKFQNCEKATRIYVEAANPYDYFAYRWIPGGFGGLEDVLTRPNTLVEFRIEETDGVSKVTLRESGFASLPPEVAEESVKQNSGGWDFMLDRLEKHFG